MKELLKNKQFLLLNLGQFVSLIGAEIQDFALALYILDITGSGTKYASILAVTIIPKIILGPILGVLSDNLDKRKIIVSLDVLSGLIILGLWGVKSSGHMNLLSIYITVILISCISSMFNPAISTVLPLIVKKDNLVEANSINSFLTSTACVGAPIIAGILLNSIGISGILLLNSLSFLFSAFTEIFLKIPNICVEKENKLNIKKYKNDFMEGFKYINKLTILKYIVISSCIINLVNNPTLSVGFPYIAKKVLGVSDSQYGVMGSIVTAASFLAPFIVTFLAKKVELMKIFIGSLICLCLISISFMINSSELFLSNFSDKLIIPVTLLCINCGCVILSVYVTNISVASLKQKSIPIEILGRVNGIQSSIAMVMIPIGQMIYGVLFDYVPVYIPFAITAVTLGILSLVLYKLLPKVSENNEIVEEVL